MAKISKTEIKAILDNALDPTDRGGVTVGVLYSVLTDVIDSLSANGEFQFTTDGIGTTYNIQHDLNSQYPLYALYRNNGGDITSQSPDGYTIIVIDENNLQVKFGATPPAGTFILVLSI